MNGIDRSLLDIYSVEQAEHVSRLRKLLADFESGETAPIVEELLRRLHTLKGAARAVGFETIENLTHLSEEVFSRVRGGSLQLNDEIRAVFEQVLDASEDLLAAVAENREAPDVSGIISQLGQVSGASSGASPSVRETPREPQPATHTSASAPAAQVRVSAQAVDDLIRESAELLMDTAADATTGTHATHLDEIVQEWVRLRRSSATSIGAMADDEKLRPLIEFLRVMDARLESLRREAQNLAARDRNSRRSLRAKAQSTYQSACRVRMTPAEGVLGAFGPMVRDLAHQEGKQVSFHAEGLELEADRVVLQGLKDPVMHLLRNAVSHGIEKPEDRQSAGKAAQGSIRLKVTSRGDRLELSIEDDGRGLDRKAILEEAANRGIDVTEDSAGLAEMERLVFRPGFSTARAVTDVSGRGMGLSVVQRAVNRLRGEVRMTASSGGGTTAFLSIPISISTQHVLLVSVGGHTFGIAAAYVKRLGRIDAAEVKIVNGRESVMTDSGPVALKRLADLLEVKSTASRVDERSQISYVVLTAPGQSAAIAVDRLVDERESIIKDTGLPDSMSGLTAGAIPMEDGTVAVMLNVTKLFDRFDVQAGASAIAQRTPQARMRKRRILVVDDSLTTRSLEKSILEAHGYQVQLAVDGLDALEHLSAELPDLVISDVSMPRMTGFQLLERIKSNEAMKKIPVILVTSLETAEEQQTGLSLGADAYIVKRKFDQRELLNVIQQII